MYYFQRLLWYWVGLINAGFFDGWVPQTPTPIKNAGGNSAGGTDGHDNMPPYRVSVFVQKIAENY